MKMYLKILLKSKYTLIGLLILFATSTYAQERVIKGTVSDNEGVLIGANIVIKEFPRQGTATDADGNFTLSLPAKAKHIEVSYVGCNSQTIAVENKTNFQIKLEANEVLLSEYVIIGYGSIKKSDLTGAVGSIKREDLLKDNPVSVNAGMQGKIAGVQVTSNDGAPGAGVSIQIRGANSFNTSVEPLYVIDGIPYGSSGTPTGGGSIQTSNPLSSINPNDIESIEVLKDASATAIYGSRGANGVVLITTRKGKEGKDKIEFSSVFGISSVKKLDVLDAETYANYINEQSLNQVSYAGATAGNLPYSGLWVYSYDGRGNIIPGSGIYSPSPEDFRGGDRIITDENGSVYNLGSSNWQDMIYQTSLSQEYNLSISGGSKKGSYLVSANYLDQEGIIKNSGFRRYTVRTNFNRNVNDWLEGGLNMTFNDSKTKFSTTSSEAGILRSALLFLPTLPSSVGYREDLNWMASNPNMYLEESSDMMEGMGVFVSSYLQFSITKDLKFRENIGYNYNNNERGFFFSNKTGAGQAPTNGYGGQSNNKYSSMVSESLLTYNKTLAKKHSINAVAGFTYENTHWNYKFISAKDFLANSTSYYNLGLANNHIRPSTGKGQSQLVSFLGRVNYSYDSKYLLTASFRSDGSSKFSEDNRFAHFASGAVAWRFTEEEFLKGQSILSNGKLRLSFGQTGNQGISSYSTMQQINSAPYPLGGSLTGGLAQTSDRMVNPNLKWETTNQYDLGLDLGFLDNRINLVVDLYYKKTRDLLQEVKVHPSTGYGAMPVNFGNVTNKGLEISANIDILRNLPLKWNLNTNIAFNRNEISGLEYDQFASGLWYGAEQIFIQRNGYPVGAIFGYVEDGYWDNEAEIRADPQYANESAAIVRNMIGEIKYMDFDGDGAITPNDKRVIGNTSPDYTYGITNSFEWNNFTFSFFLQGSQGNDIFNGNLTDITMSNMPNIPRFAYESRWTEENMKDAKWPKAAGGYDRAWYISDRYVEDGSYLRLKNINFGYKFHKPIKGIDLIHLYFTANNIKTWTNYSWHNPDVNVFGGDASRRGVDLYTYPLAKSFSFGLNLSF